jgi:hypothetical protein
VLDYLPQSGSLSRPYISLPGSLIASVAPSLPSTIRLLPSDQEEARSALSDDHEECEDDDETDAVSQVHGLAESEVGNVSSAPSLAPSSVSKFDIRKISSRRNPFQVKARFRVPTNKARSGLVASSFLKHREELRKELLALKWANSEHLYTDSQVYRQLSNSRSDVRTGRQILRYMKIRLSRQTNIMMLMMPLLERKATLATSPKFGPRIRNLFIIMLTYLA